MPTKPFLDKRPDQNSSSEVSENRFIRGKRRARRTLEVDVRTGRTASGRRNIEVNCFSAKAQETVGLKNLPSACVRALEEAGAAIELTFLIFTVMDTITGVTKLRDWDVSSS